MLIEISNFISKQTYLGSGDRNQSGFGSFKAKPLSTYTSQCTQAWFGSIQIHLSILNKKRVEQLLNAIIGTQLVEKFTETNKPKMLFTVNNMFSAIFLGLSELQLSPTLQPSYSQERAISTIKSFAPQRKEGKIKNCQGRYLLTLVCESARLAK